LLEAPELPPLVALSGNRATVIVGGPRATSCTRATFGTRVVGGGTTVATVGASVLVIVSPVLLEFAEPHQPKLVGTTT
jgi:hypothetical protein